MDGRVVRRSLADVARSNTLFGGTHAASAEVLHALREDAARAATLLDVGTGAGDIPARLRALGARRGVGLATMGVEGSETLARAASSPALPMVRADALALPFATASVDIVMCSQLLHHFERECALILLGEMHRVARRWVVVSDLRRSWIAAAGIWLASFPLRFHPVSRHDGVVSVLRGFTANELREMVRAATGCTPTVEHHAGFRVTARWRAGSAPA